MQATPIMLVFIVNKAKVENRKSDCHLFQDALGLSGIRNGEDTVSPRL